MEKNKIRYSYEEAKELYEEFVSCTLEFMDFISMYPKAKGRGKAKELSASIALFSYIKAKDKAEYNEKKAQYNKYVFVLAERWEKLI